MLEVNQYKNEDVLQQNCRVGRVFVKRGGYMVRTYVNGGVVEGVPFVEKDRLFSMDYVKKMIRSVIECKPLELCSPSAEFDMIEKCTICKKTI